MVQRFTGTRVKRVEDPRLLTGRSRFVDDISLPGMLYAAFVRSTVPHARIASIDAAAAREMPGIVAVYVGADLPEHANPLMLQPVEGLKTPAFYALAHEKVRFVGEPVAMVVAESRYQAEDACDSIYVEYEPLPPVTDMEAAIRPDSAVLFDELGDNVMYHSEAKYGDLDAAFAGADRVITEKISQHRYANVPMEGHAGLSSFDPSMGELVHYSSHQGPHMLRFGLSFLLRLPLNNVRVLCGDVGGAFGSKGYFHREEIMTAFASMRLGKPVKWAADRNENLLAGGQTREESAVVEAAVKNDGTLLGLRVKLIVDQGAYQCVPYPTIVFPLLARALMPSAYRITNFEFHITMAATNKAPYIAYRGPWEIETFLRERLWDILAVELGLDPVEIRRKNLWENQELPRPLATGAAILKNLTVRECLDQAVAAIDYPGFRQEQERARAQGRYLGLGISCFMEPAPQPIFGIGFDFVRSETATVQLEPDGGVTVFTAQAPHGQGHETTIAQVCADGMGVSMSQVKVIHGDTRVVPFTNIGTGASRGATMPIGAALGALRIIKDRVLRIAGHMLETAPEDLQIVNGVVSPIGGGDRSVSLFEIAIVAYTAPFTLPPGTDTEMKATYTFDYEGAWAQSCHAALVEVDTGTGKVEIKRYVVVEDCGEPIHPAIVDGQICGGIAQGIGAVLYEKSAYDEDGQYLAGTFMDYLLPTSMEVPHIEIHHIIPETDEEIPHHGVGEGGLIGSPACVVNAIEDALRPLGVKIREQYLPPARILELIGSIK